MGAELLQRPLGDVVESLTFRIAVSSQYLGGTWNKHVLIWQSGYGDHAEVCTLFKTETKSNISMLSIGKQRKVLVWSVSDQWSKIGESLHEWPVE